MNQLWKYDTAAMQVLLDVHDLFMTSDAGCEELIPRICQEVRESFDLRGVLIGRLTAATRLDPLGSAGLDAEDMDSLLALYQEGDPGTPAIEAVKSDQMLVLNRLDSSKANISWRNWAERVGTRAALFCPLKLQDGAAGLLAVYARHRDAFDARTQALMQTLALNIAFGLHMKQEFADRRAAARQLELAAAVFDNAAEGILITDARGVIIAVNRAVCKVTGYNREELLGQNPKVFSSGQHGQEFYNGMWASIRKNGQWKGEIYNRRKTGEVYPEWLSIVGIQDVQGAVANYIAIFTDITRQKENEEHLNYLAFHDGLTGLPNRTLFKDRLAQGITHTARTQKKMGLLFIDLDRFKDVNDTAGHATGDLLLQAVASRLTACVRAGDTLARLGGDEFTIILRDIHSDIETAHVADRILRSLAEAFYLEGKEFYITPSIGISLFPEDGNNPDDLMKKADAAMYRAKELGRNNYKFFTEDMNQVTLRRVAMEQLLRCALGKGELYLVYQPQVNATTLRITGVEALIRWHSPELGEVSPTEFIPVAEETGLIHEIGDWVLQTACHQAHAWHAAGGPGLRMSVNLSASQFRQKGLVEVVRNALALSGLEPACLEVELTETVAMQTCPETMATMQALKDLGIRIALDDFGTGYSSLSYLRKFPIDTLKIDRTFINELSNDPQAGAIIRAIITMAQNLGLNVIAEGVETPYQADFLLTHLCNEIQGFYFYRPLTAEQCSELILTGNAVQHTPPHAAFPEQ